MSEFQRFQWKKVGRCLNSKQRKEVMGLSSHISVNGDSAEVTYNWGSFKHDPLAVLTRYFDIFLYESNWGIQRVGFRFDPDTVDVDQLTKFQVEDLLKITDSQESVYVNLWVDENWVEPDCYFDDQYHEIEDFKLQAFETIYRQIQQGDYRGLFILWLKCCEHSSDETITVNLPKGMADLDVEHGVVSRFVGIDELLIKQASERSLPLPQKKKRQDSLDHYLPKLPVKRKEEFLRRLVSEDAFTVKSALVNELRKLGNQPRSNYLGESISYQDLAQAAKAEAQLQEQRAKEEKERRRKAYLEKLGQHEHKLLQRVHELVAEKKTKSYEAALLLLRGLEDLWVSRNDLAAWLGRSLGVTK